MSRWLRALAHIGGLTCILSSLQVQAASSAPEPVRLPAQVTLDDALRIFRAWGLDLLIAEAAVQSAQADVTVAGATPNPALSAAGGIAVHNVTPCGDPCAAWSFGLSDQNALSDRINGKRRLRVAVADAAYQAARLTRADAQRTLELQLETQYIQTVLARDTLDFQLEVQKSTTRTFELTQTRYQAGAISEADLAKVETTKLEADQAVSSATANLKQAKAALAFLLGVRGEIPAFEVEQNLPRFVIPGSLANVDPATLLRQAFENRPDLRAQAFQQQRAETSITLARRLRVPDVALQASAYGQGTGVLSTQPPTLILGVSFPIPVFYLYQGEIQKAEVDRRTQDLQQARLQAQVTADVTTAFTAFVSSRELVERMEGRLLGRVARSRDLVSLQYQKGAASLLEFLDAQRTFIATNNEYLQDLAAYWIAVFQLEAAVGARLR